MMKDRCFNRRTVIRNVGREMVEATEDNHNYNEQKAKWITIS
jgi:hypothetical protein